MKTKEKKFDAVQFNGLLICKIKTLIVLVINN